MPQMSPINWLFLFIMFLMIFFFINMMIYYSTLSLYNFKLKNMNMFYTKSYSWKW